MATLPCEVLRSKTCIVVSDNHAVV